MNKTIFNKRASLKFSHFSNKGYSLFSVLGRVVAIGALSVTTLTYAKAEGISVEVSGCRPTFRSTVAPSTRLQFSLTE